MSARTRSTAVRATSMSAPTTTRSTCVPRAGHRRVTVSFTAPGAATDDGSAAAGTAGGDVRVVARRRHLDDLVRLRVRAGVRRHGRAGVGAGTVLVRRDGRQPVRVLRAGLARGIHVRGPRVVE